MNIVIIATTDLDYCIVLSSMQAFARGPDELCPRKLSCLTL